MPRQAAAAAGFAPTSTARPMLRPPSDLNALEKQEFADIICGVDVHHFIPADAALIGELAQYRVLWRTAFGELRASGYISDGKASAWLTILQHAAKEVRSISRALSLTPASYRQQPKPGGWKSRTTRAKIYLRAIPMTSQTDTLTDADIDAMTRAIATTRKESNAAPSADRRQAAGRNRGRVSASSARSVADGQFASRSVRMAAAVDQGKHRRGIECAR